MANAWGDAWGGDTGAWLTAWGSGTSPTPSPAFPRTRLPEVVGALFLPGALKDMSHSGLLQIRNTKQIGWSWTEEWNLLSARNPDDMGLMAFITRTWNRGEIHQFTHPMTPGSGISRNGVGTGTPAVNGSSQTGTSLITNGWTGGATTNAVRAGDVIKIAGDAAVYMIDTDGSSDSGGNLTLSITPPLRQSPSDGSLLTISNVTFTATIMSRSQFEGSSAPQYYGGLKLVIGEALI